MSTVQCPLCGLRFGHRSEFELHAREDHVHRSFHRHVDTHGSAEDLPAPRKDGRAGQAPAGHAG